MLIWISIAFGATLMVPTQPASPVTGQWRGQGVEVEIRQDGTYTWQTAQTTLHGTWAVEADVIRFLGERFLVDYRFRLQGRRLSFIGVDGSVVGLVRIGPAPKPPVDVADLKSPQRLATTAPTKEEQRLFLKLLQKYRTMQPKQVRKRYLKLHPTLFLQLQIYDAVHRDMVLFICDSPKNHDILFVGIGEQKNCHQLQQELAEAYRLGAQMGMDIESGRRSMLSQQRTSLLTSLRCSLGKEDPGVCSAYLGTMQQINQSTHETNTLINDNLRDRPQWQVKQP